MNENGILREVEEKLYRGATGGILGQAALVQRSFVGGLTQDRIVRWTGWACGVLSESLTMLAGEIDQLREQLMRLDTQQ